MVSSKNVKVSKKRCLGTSIGSFTGSSPSERIIGCEIWYQKDLWSYPAGENSSFIFTVCVKSVPLYYFQDDRAFGLLHHELPQILVLCFP